MSNESRIDAIIEMISSMAALEFDKVIQVDNSDDPLNVVSKGLNMLAEELQDSVVEKAELEIKNKELEQFSYVISHDLKAPLRRINFLTVLLEDAIKEKDANDIDTYLLSLRDITVHMEQLINDVLQLSKVGLESIEYQYTDMGQLVREVCSIINVPERYDISFQTYAPQIWVRKGLMVQVFLNLISNSINHNNKVDGTTKIIYKDLGSYHEFKVTDNGPGIERKYQDKIFELFRTGEHEQKHKGSGIGLAIVKKIVELEKGKISVESKPGKGATFTFRIQKITNPL